jgi:DNA topoisomerase-1
LKNKSNNPLKLEVGDERSSPRVGDGASEVRRHADAAQEAHEAIRPTGLSLEPDVQLEPDAEALYSLISRRFLASQCKPAVYEKTVARLSAARHTLLATGRVLVTPSFLAFLAEDEDEAAARAAASESPRESEDVRLPRLSVAQPLQLSRVEPLGAGAPKTEEPEQALEELRRAAPAG